MSGLILRKVAQPLVSSVLLAFACGTAATAPTSVNVTGNLQGEVGCPGDFAPDCTATELVYDATDDVWQLSLDLPTGAYEYFAALDGSFAIRYGRGAALGGPAISLDVSADGPVKFYYDDKSHWITDNVTSVIGVLAGSFQSELGCASDFDAGCLRTWLQDLDGDGLYTFSSSALPAGSYGTVVALNESFAESYGKGGLPGNGNVEFDVAYSGQSVHFVYDSRSHLLQVIAASPVPEPSSALLLVAGVALLSMRMASRSRGR